MSPLLTVEELHVEYASGGGTVHAVRGVDLEVAAGQTLAVVGESGSGKSTTAHAVIRLLPPNATLTHGSVTVAEQNVLALSERSLRQFRGGTVGLVPQDPGNSLNPLERVGWQIAQVLALHGIARGARARARAVELLAEVALPDPERAAAARPGELSGGMRQRAMIALALAAGPRLVVADEPTSALDVTVQRQVLDTLQRRVRDHGAAMLLVTHDLGVAADRADHVVVMKDGVVVERGTVAQVLQAPQHPYTQTLIASAPGLRRRPVIARAAATSQNREVADVVLHAAGLVKDFTTRTLASSSTVRALDGVSVTVRAGRTLGVVGESGSGKTTLARVVARLEQPDAGTVRLEGRDITALRGEPLRAIWRDLQIVYQNPYASLQPRFDVERIVTEPLRHFRIGDARSRRRRAAELLEQVALPSALLTRAPEELSGGQRQRVAIARALALRPKLLLLDEPVSALDVTVQAQILDLLAHLQAELGLAYLFITHDLAVVQQIAHEVAVMSTGTVLEHGPTERILNAPQHPYTQQLLDAVPGAAAPSPYQGAPA